MGASKRIVWRSGRIASLSLVAACNGSGPAASTVLDTGPPPTTFGEDTTDDATASGTMGTLGDDTSATNPTGETVDDTGTVFDLGIAPDIGIDTGPTESCYVIDDMDAVGDCEASAPPDSFEPAVQWSWPGENGEVFSVVTPLVANLTDDDGNGEINLCDIPDVVVVAWSNLFTPGHMYVLDGETGISHFRIETPVDGVTCPALGDIDGDGLPEIIGVQTGGVLVAFEHDGTPKWSSTTPWTEHYIGALSLADVDNDGDVEIIAGHRIFDHEGNQVIALGASPMYASTTAVDLDDDDDLEIVLGNAAYHHDGALVWNAAGIASGFPQVANLDADPQPEILVNNDQGISLLDHDGTVQYQNLRPTGDPVGANVWFRPSTIHDFDGDGVAEYAVSSANNYSVYEANGSILWSSPVSDLSGIAAGTAFDFLGDGDAEAMYADESFMFIFDGAGEVLLQTPRTSRTGTEYPVVADIDNDGSAEIVVVSNEPISGGGGVLPPPVQVIRDVEDRWIQARRIWNQHTYHVTNVREDGTIPQIEPHHWELLNTFRTNAQIEGGGLCVPEPQG